MSCLLKTIITDSQLITTGTPITPNIKIDKLVLLLSTVNHTKSNESTLPKVVHMLASMFL